MSVRVGTDLQPVADVAAALADFGARYRTRLFTDRERAGLDGADEAQRLAARFAAKEAVLKVLRAGDRAIDLRCIEILRADDGAPVLSLSGAAAELAAAAHLSGWDVSLSHTDDLASATVVALAHPPTLEEPCT